MGFKKYLLDTIFPFSCLICKKEGSCLCADCRAILEVSRVHKKYSGAGLGDLYCALPCQNPFVRDLVRKFKYEPFVKELGKSFSSLMIEHLNLIDNKPDFTGFFLVPVPIKKKELKWRGYGQAEELAKELSVLMGIPVISDALIATEEEKSNEGQEITRAFSCPDRSQAEGRRLLLVNDVFAAGSVMEECAKELKMAGAEEIIGIAFARQ